MTNEIMTREQALELKMALAAMDKQAQEIRMMLNVFEASSAYLHNKLYHIIAAETVSR